LNTNSSFNLQVDVMQYPVFTGKVSDITFTKSLLVIQTINAYSYVMAQRTVAFKTALQQADILIADGFPIVLAAKLLKKQNISKIAGADLFFHFMNIMEQQHGRVFFIGSANNTLEKIKQRVAVDYPHISVGVYSPPYKASFSKDDSVEMLSQINAFSADVVYVGMTAPKQEVWVNSNKEQIQAKAICSIGAVFDFYAGTVQRAPQWMINVKAEWFYRLVREPKRMWRRYLVYSPLFFRDLLLYMLSIKK